MGARVVSTPAPSGSRWLARPRVLVISGAAVAVVALLFAAAISAQQSTAAELQRAHDELGVTREAVVAHAAAMRAQSDRLMVTAQRSSSAHRQHWIDDASGMATEAARLDDTARLLGNQAALLGEHLGRSVRSDLSFVHSAGDALVSEGDQLLVHGRAMREHAIAMEEFARSSETDITPADVALLRDGADRLTDAGERTRSVGILLSQVGEQFMRSIGR